MGRGEYLLEVRSEEIPARMLEPGVRELATRVFEDLMARGVGPREIETGFTPRRLVLRLSGLPAREPDREEQVLGPPVRAALAADGSPTPALIGFARRCGVEPADLQRVPTERGEYLAATRRTAGRPVAQVLAELVPRTLTQLSWPKFMRWGAGDGPWVRPVHGVVSLLDGEVVPFELFGIAAGDETRGHPVLSPRPIRVRSAAEYRRKLATRQIEVDPKRRRATLLAAMHARAAALGGCLVEDAPLLDKLAALCEIPGVVEGGFDAAFLELPAEVLATSLRDHQSALTVVSSAAPADALLLPYFLTVMDRADDPAGRTRSGNEWVVAARLADARFFYGEDRKAGLARRAEQLHRLAFHDKLGSYAAKTERVTALAATLCAELGWPDAAPAAAAAARWLKADLATEMVKEFTSLQGVIGGLYAREEGLPEAAWQAIYDQYLPASAEDRIPRGRAGLVVGLADRFDTLVGMFGLGLVPTGSRDPFGLRRAAQGAVRIAFEGKLAVNLGRLVAAAAALYGARPGAGAPPAKAAAGAPATPADTAAAGLASLRPFLEDRIRYVLGLYGYAYDEIEAALAADAGDLPDLRARVEAVHRVRAEPAFLSLALAAKRIANIVKDQPEQAHDAQRPAEPAEHELAVTFAGLRAEVEAAAAAGDHERGLRRLAGLAPVLDRFFVEVLVMDPDLAVRANRIALLQAILRTMNRSVRLAEVVVDRAEQRTRAGAAAEGAPAAG
jgi:glycyl-tRNA synthetase beta chain